MSLKLRTRTVLLSVAALRGLVACGVDAPLEVGAREGGVDGATSSAGGSPASGSGGRGADAGGDGGGGGDRADGGGSGGADASLGSGGAAAGGAGESGGAGGVAGGGPNIGGAGGAGGAGGGAAAGAGGAAANPECEACMSASCGSARGAVASLCVGAAKAGCDALLACIERTGCDRTGVDPFTGYLGIDVRSCYCGDVDVSLFPQCFAATLASDPSYPHGACRGEFEVLAGEQAPSAVGGKMFDSAVPLGSIGMLLTCANQACVQPQVGNLEPAPCCDTCGPDLGVGAGGSGAGGASGSGGVASAGGAAATGGTSSEGGQGAGGSRVRGLRTGDIECDNCVGAFCTAAIELIRAECVGADAAACSAVLECANETGCSEGDIDEVTGLPGVDLRFCYCGAGADLGLCFSATAPSDAHYPHGACRAPIEALASATAPAAVGATFFDGTTPMGAVAQLFACRNAACVAQQRESGAAPLCLD